MYNDLIDLMYHPQFNCDHVVKNVRRFQSWRQKLSLMTIYSRPVGISVKKTPSNLKNSKNLYYLSITDIIWHVLNNSSLMKHMYFGPGQEVINKSEYWHDNLWAESPLFDQESIVINEGKKKKIIINFLIINQELITNS